MDPLNLAKGYKSEISPISLEGLSALSLETPNLPPCLGIWVYSFCPPPFRPHPGRTLPSPGSAEDLVLAPSKLLPFGQVPLWALLFAPAPGASSESGQLYANLSCHCIFPCLPPGPANTSPARSSSPSNLQLPSSDPRSSAMWPVCFHSQPP